MSTNITCVYKNQDHTLCSTLKEQLLKNDDVIFAAYKIPHSLIPEVELRVQTLELSGVNAIKTAAKEIIDDLNEFEKAFQKAFE